jgi:hypothetical protein
MVIDKLEKAGATQIQVVDDNLNLTLDIDDGIIDEAEDTITILKNYVNNLELDADKVELESLMRELYSEAMSLE